MELKAVKKIKVGRWYIFTIEMDGRWHIGKAEDEIFVAEVGYSVKLKSLMLHDDDYWADPVTVWDLHEMIE